MRFSKALDDEIQEDALLITCESRKDYVLCKTLLNAECHLIKEIPEQLRNNIEAQDQTFSPIVNQNPGVCLQLSTSEEQILISCMQSNVHSVNECFDTEIKRYVEASLIHKSPNKNKGGYSSSDSVEYLPD